MNKSFQELAQEQIIKHGRDRYPTPHEQFTKVVEELGEVAKALNNYYQLPRTNGPSIYRAFKRLQSEMADAQLAFAELANKIDISLEEVVYIAVNNDERMF